MTTWSPQSIVLGLEGLDLKRDLRQVPQTKLSRMSNLVQLEEGGLTVRPGQTNFASSGTTTTFHSIGRLNNPFAGTYNRFWGVGTDLFRGIGGLLGAAVESGFSGNPLAFVPYRPPLSGESWMFVADSNKMRKVRASDGLSLPIGLPAPSAACKTVLGAENFAPIEQFEGGFAAHIGDGGGGAPVLGYYPGKSTNCMRISTTPGGALSGYSSYADKGISVDLSTFSGGAAASDDDLMHLWLYVDNPGFVTEIRVYLVCSATFTPGVVPGDSVSAGANSDAFMKAFRVADVTQSLDQSQTVSTAGDQESRRRQADDTQVASGTDDSRSGKVATRVDGRDPARVVSRELGPGASQWTQFGVVGVPLRRGEFQRVGTDEARGWNTITGICVLVQANTNQIVTVQIDDFYMRGGSGIDSTEVGSSPYDYRVTNFDPRTGAESNPSIVQDEADWLDSERRSIVVTPGAYGDAFIRQRAYRRGGSLVDDWYFAGENTSDGGDITDLESDLAVSAAGTLAIDHHQPVNTVTSAGVTVSAQPVPCLWGPVQDLLFACGDPYRPGDVYWPLPGQPDHWPEANHVEVCSPSEELMNGCVWGGQAWVFSRLSLYQLIPNLSGSGTVSAIPTSCKSGLAGKWAFCVGQGGIYFVAADGIYNTTGGEATNLTDGDIRGLFHGETRNGYLPVDFTRASSMRLVVHDNELRFLYADTGGTGRELVYNLLTRRWRWNTYARTVASFYSDETLGLIMGGYGTGAAYTNTGDTDDGVSIAFNARTGALDQGAPRAEKTYAEVMLEADLGKFPVDIQAHLDDETEVLSAETIAPLSGRLMYRSHPFGAEPRHARSVSVDISGSTSSTAPRFYLLHLAAVGAPELSGERVTVWENAGSAFEKYVLGVTLDFDTGGVDKEFLVEGRLEDGSTSTIDTVTVNADGRHQRTFSWTAAKATLIRLRPTDDTPWLLYDLSWMVVPEPPRVAAWDSLFTTESTFADKWVKGVLLDCDTLNLPKSVDVYGDGVLQTTLTVQANGRRALHFSFPQFRARVLRLVATDINLGLLYGREWIFDIEPYQLTRWESQEINHGLVGWHTLIRGDITVRSTADVTLTLRAYRQDGTYASSTYTLPATGGVKIPVSVPFAAQKGVLYKYLFTSADAWWLYREESTVLVQPCQGGDILVRHPFGNDDLDQTRGMTSASGAASRGGGTL